MKKKRRWTITKSGIFWDCMNDPNLPHEDSLEMSGFKTSLLVKYGVDKNGVIILNYQLIFPALRMIPNNTKGSFMLNLSIDDLPAFECEGKKITEYPLGIHYDGVLTINSKTTQGLHMTRQIYPSADKQLCANYITINNQTNSEKKLRILNGNSCKYARGTTGEYIVSTKIKPEGDIVLPIGQSQNFSLIISARRANEPNNHITAEAELYRRRARVAELLEPLQLYSGNQIVDKAFALCKIRAGESIFDTRGGLMHSPGGGTYYAGTWCNDQLEYAAPYFAYTGDSATVTASFNAFRQYIPFMTEEFKSIPSSVIAEGFDIWEGVGDRGDAAMFAYGATRFVLVVGDKLMGTQLWKAIQWTLEYCRRHLNAAGVVLSDTDELENRLPSGSANLCTSSLYYGALLSASYIARDFGEKELAQKYKMQAAELAANIEKFFGADIAGYKTYRYYDGNTTLRAWIGIPLCMGIAERAEGTVNAMFSDRLWLNDSMLSCEGETRTWDRSALYAFRGAFNAGKVDLVWELFENYSKNRLQGEHVPYPIEAWPEGNQRQLAAESALYCRVIMEGVLGIEPLGFKSFRIRPVLPACIDEIILKNIYAFDCFFDIVVHKQRVKILKDGYIFCECRPGDIVDLT